MQNENALIIFVRNPEPGKVKTRLADGIGNEQALAVYIALLEHTKNVAWQTHASLFVFYADAINTNDLWNGCEKQLQSGNDLGARMQNAFETVFHTGYKKACIIGSDCPGLTTEIIATGFEQLATNDIILGPSTDGGYYLLGLTGIINELFENKQWSTGTVFSDTKANAEQLKKSIYLLPELSDIDTADDLMATGFKWK